MPFDPRDDAGPHESDEPLWRDSWAFTAVDPRAGAGFIAHVIWSPVALCARHTVVTFGSGTADKAEAITSDVWRSELLTIEVDDPWRRWAIRSPRTGVAVDCVASHAPVDFHDLLRLDAAFALRHYESALVATGTLDGRAFSGAGVRDRSFGPRSSGRMGRHVNVGLVAIDGSWSASSNRVLPITASLDDEQAIVSMGYVDTGGALRRLHAGDAQTLRTLDGTPRAIRLLERTVSIVDVLGTARVGWLWDPAAPVEPAERGVYTSSYSLVVGREDAAGTVVGFVDEGVWAAF